METLDTGDGPLQVAESSLLTGDDSAQQDNSRATDTPTACPDLGAGFFQYPGSSSNSRSRSKESILQSLQWDWAWANPNYCSIEITTSDRPEITLAPEPSPQTFPQFAKLPIEIQDLIWTAALPSRVISSFLLSPRTCERWHWRIPLPPLARVCKLSRQAVLRSGHPLQVEERWSGHRSTVGYILNSDTFCISIGSAHISSGMYSPKGVRDELASDDLKLFNGRAGRMSLDACIVYCLVVPFFWLQKDAPRVSFPVGHVLFRKFPSLKVVQVDCWPRLYLDIALNSIGSVEVCHLGFRGHAISEVPNEETLSRRTVLVDLFDDKLLRQICSLGSHGGGQPMELTKAHDTQLQESINCFRREWQTSYRAATEAAWSRLLKKEKKSLRGRGQEKIAKAPEFRPVLWLSVYWQ
ncbi:hypothetical protein LIA77_01556 [Sarocladium implicatum]|nr:hypothetical protein LIA77_01556 [Sarocladium implicatum]